MYWTPAHFCFFAALALELHQLQQQQRLQFEASVSAAAGICEDAAYILAARLAA